MKVITAVRPDDGFDHWHNVTCHNYSLTGCRSDLGGRFSAHIAIREIGALAISDIAAETKPGNTIAVSRSPADIRKDPRDYFMLWLMLDGQVGLEQRCHSSAMRAGIFLCTIRRSRFFEFRSLVAGAHGYDSASAAHFSATNGAPASGSSCLRELKSCRIGGLVGNKALSS